MIITNIVLRGNRFLVFYSVNGNDENVTFDPNITADGIKSYIQERKEYYDELANKELLLQEELIGEL